MRPVACRDPRPLPHASAVDFPPTTRRQTQPTRDHDRSSSHDRSKSTMPSSLPSVNGNESDRPLAFAGQYVCRSPESLSNESGHDAGVLPPNRHLPHHQGEGTVRNMASVRRAHPLPHRQMRRCPDPFFCPVRIAKLGTKTALDQRVAGAVRLGRSDLRAAKPGCERWSVLHSRKAIFLGHMC